MHQSQPWHIVNAFCCRYKLFQNILYHISFGGCFGSKVDRNLKSEWAMIFKAISNIHDKGINRCRPLRYLQLVACSSYLQNVRWYPRLKPQKCVSMMLACPQHSVWVPWWLTTSGLSNLFSFQRWCSTVLELERPKERWSSGSSWKQWTSRYGSQKT